MLLPRATAALYVSQGGSRDFAEKLFRAPLVTWLTACLLVEERRPVEVWSDGDKPLQRQTIDAVMQLKLTTGIPSFLI